MKETILDSIYPNIKDQNQVISNEKSFMLNDASEIRWFLRSYPAVVAVID